MFSPSWLRQLAQQWLPRSGKRPQRSAIRRVRPGLEVLEDRLTPSSDMLAILAPRQPTPMGQPPQAITVQLEDSGGKAIAASSNVTVNLGSSSNTGRFLDASGNPLTTPSLVIPKGASSVRFE